MESQTEKKHGCLFIGSIMLITIVISVGATIWIFTQYIFPKRFDPVKLSTTEQQKLERKLRVFEGFGDRASSGQASATNDLEPEKYSEEGANRRIELTERELNGMLANNTDLAERLIIDLSENLASGKLLVPLDPDFPIMGGKTLKISAGMELAFRNEKPIVVLKGISIMGVPIPNAWLGNIKNVDLVREFGGSEGFWKSFADGVENVEVSEGRLIIQLRE
ncbi:MAG: arginine N-succinyltransferase [bacterium]